MNIETQIKLAQIRRQELLAERPRTVAEPRRSQSWFARLESWLIESRIRRAQPVARAE